MRQTIPLSLLATTQQQRAHGRGLAHANRRHRRADVRHGVVDGEAGGDRPARGVYIQRDWLFGGVGFEEEELGDDVGGGGEVDFAHEADDAFF